MANQFFNHGKHQLGLAAINMGTADWRVLLVMGGFNFTTEKDKTNLSTMTLDEYDGAGYARQALANEAWTKDAANNRSELTADPTVFSSLGPGSAQCTAALVYIHVTDDTDAVPFLKVDDGGFPFDGTGSDNTITWDSEGLIQL